MFQLFFFFSTRISKHYSIKCKDFPFSHYVTWGSFSKISLINIYIYIYIYILHNLVFILFHLSIFVCVYVNAIVFFFFFIFYFVVSFMVRESSKLAFFPFNIFWTFWVFLVWRTSLESVFQLKNVEF